MRGERGKSGLALVGAVVAAATASLCCILPVIAAVLGVTGFAAAEFFARWRPYLLALTFALLALGFYLAYRPRRREECKPGSLCERTPLERWNRAILWLVTALVIALAAFPYYSGWAVRRVGKNTQQVALAARSPTARVVLKIEGMDCPVCAAGLQNQLREIPGVRRAEVSFQDKRASLDYDPRAVDPSRFTKAIAEAGFKVATAARGKP